MRIKLTIFCSGEIEETKIFKNEQLAYEYLDSIGFWGNPEKTYSINFV